MAQSRQPPARPVFGSLVLIAVVIAGGAAAFAYTAGWFSPQRLTPDKFVDAFTPPTGPPLGHRRNHAKGICFTGVFEANGAGTALSHAQVFTRGQYPVLGRFNLGTPDPNAPDATVRVRGLGLRISPPDGQEWRSAMVNPPFFPVSTPQAFYELLLAFLVVVFAYALAENLQVTHRWLERPYLFVFPAIGVIAALVAAESVRSRRDEVPYHMVALIFAAAFGTLAISFWPYMIPFSITIEQAAAPHSSLAFMFWGEGLFVFPLMLVYTVISYSVFRGKVRPTADHY